jgi:hypothetical protein
VVPKPFFNFTTSNIIIYLLNIFIANQQKSTKMRNSVITFLLKAFLMLIVLTAILSEKTFSQGTSLSIVSYTLSNYNGGYNVKCYGATNGTFNINVGGGVTPYSYSWSNGATTQNLTGIAAGAYTVTVTDASVSGATATLTATLLQANLLTSTLTDVQHSGYDISCNGGNDGAITNTIGGGTPPYQYLWNDASVNQNYSNASAGTYSVTVVDMNTCSATSTITMTQPSPIIDTLTSPTNSYGFNTSCGAFDGIVNLTVSGGVSTYTFSWNSGQHAQNLNVIPGGLYSVVITDQNGCTVNNSITVTSPPLLTAVNDSAVVYLNNANVSSDTANDGIITALPVGGTSPYTFQWSPGTFGTTQTITGCPALTAGTAAQYSVTVTDAGGCVNSLKGIMLIPAGSNDWNITGNHGEAGFIGTLDSVDFVVKSHSAEAMRVSANGNIHFNSNISDDSLSFNDTSAYQDTYRMVGVDHSGHMKLLNQNISNSGIIGNPQVYCSGIYTAQNWQDIICALVTYDDVGIGTNNYPTAKLDVYGNGTTSSTYALKINDHSSNPLLAIRDDGFVGIGTTSPSNTNATQKLEIDGGDFMVKGVNNFNQPGRVAYAYIGDQNNYIMAINGGTIGTATYVGGLAMGVYGNSSSDLFYLTSISGSLSIGIGTNSIPTGCKLAVNGLVYATELKVKLYADWPDFVFTKDHPLMELSDLDKYIDKYQHLPNIPSANEIKKEGINLGEMQTRQMEKTEELYLYVIKIEKEIQELKKENEALKKQIKKSGK